MNSESIILSICISLNLLFLAVGFIIGRIIIPVHKQEMVASEQSGCSFFKKQKQDQSVKQQQLIDIDERKVVVAIKTDGLEKKYENLGDVKKSSENISSSIDKLKNMKGL